MGLLTELVEAWSSLVSIRTARTMRSGQAQDAIWQRAVAMRNERLRLTGEGGDQGGDTRQPQGSTPG